MSSYSIAQAKNNLSRLVDEVLEGKDVIITRHGKPVVEMRPSGPQAAGPKRSAGEMLEWLQQRRDALPKLDVKAVDVIRTMRDEF